MCFAKWTKTLVNIGNVTIFCLMPRPFNPIISCLPPHFCSQTRSGLQHHTEVISIGLFPPLGSSVWTWSSVDGAVGDGVFCYRGRHGGQALEVHSLPLHLECALVPFLVEDVFSQFPDLAICCRTPLSTSQVSLKEQPRVKSSFCELLTAVEKPLTNAHGELPQLLFWNQLTVTQHF